MVAISRYPKSGKYVVFAGMDPAHVYFTADGLAIMGENGFGCRQVTRRLDTLEEAKQAMADYLEYANKWGAVL